METHTAAVIPTPSAPIDNFAEGTWNAYRAVAINVKTVKTATINAFSRFMVW
jgi:hypothetical protein